MYMVFQYLEIDDHAGFIQNGGTDIDFYFPVMAVQVFAFSPEFPELMGGRKMGDDSKFVHCHGPLKTSWNGRLLIGLSAESYHLFLVRFSRIWFSAFVAYAILVDDTDTGSITAKHPIGEIIVFFNPVIVVYFGQGRSTVTAEIPERRGLLFAVRTGARIKRVFTMGACYGHIILLLPTWEDSVPSDLDQGRHVEPVFYQ
jgi:hypothetical protein